METLARTAPNQIWSNELDGGVPQAYRDLSPQQQIDALRGWQPYTPEVSVEEGERLQSLSEKLAGMALERSMRTGNVFATGTENFTRELTQAVLPVSFPTTAVR